MNHLTLLHILLTSFCFPLSAEAVLLRSLDELQVIEVPLSQEDFTRINVKEDRIAHVFGNRDKYLIEADEEGGQIFLKPRMTSPFNISLRTESGLTQDLRLIPREKESEALILIKNDLKERAKEKTPLNREEVEDLIKACVQNLIPRGYVRVPVDVSRPPSPFLLLREFRNAHLRGLTFQTEGTPSEEDFIKAGPIPKSQIVALSLTQTSPQGGFIHVVARISH